MITKGQIEKVDFVNNNYTVRVPIFESAGYSDKAYLSCTISYQPGNMAAYRVGDVVFVGFEDNVIDNAVILGKLYLGEEKEARTSILAETLKVAKTTQLPADTTIGSIKFTDIIDNIQKSIVIEDVLENKLNIADAQMIAIDNAWPVGSIYSSTKIDKTSVTDYGKYGCKLAIDNIYWFPYSSEILYSWERVENNVIRENIVGEVAESGHFYSVLYLDGKLKDISLLDKKINIVSDELSDIIEYTFDEEHKALYIDVKRIEPQSHINLDVTFNYLSH